MSGYRSVNYYDLCRLCTTSSGTKIHIFSNEGKKKNLYQKISECLPISVNEEDKLPKILCGQCLQQVETISEFRNTCINSQAMLEGCLSSTLQNGGKVYIKDATPRIVNTQIVNQIKQPVNTNTITTTHNSDFLSSIIQAVGIQANDEVTVENRTNSTPHYTVTLDGKSINTGQIQYKVEDSRNITLHSDKQAKQNSLAEFLKMKPNIKVTPISKKKVENTQQAQVQVQSPITITHPEQPKMKKPKYNIVLTSPSQQKQHIMQNAVTPTTTQIQQPSTSVGKTVSLQDVKIISPGNKCFLPITLKDCNSDQQIVAQIDTKNLVLPTTYHLQMKLQPQLATVDGQPIMQLTPTAIPATLSITPTQTISTQNYQTDHTNTNQILSSGIDASTSTNEPEIIFTTTANQMQSHQQAITIQPITQPTTHQTTMQKLQITTIPTSMGSTQIQAVQNQKTQSAITVQMINPQHVKIKTEPSAKLPTQPQQTVQQTTKAVTVTTSSNIKPESPQQSGPMLQCTVCGRAFKKKEHLAQHMKLHAGLRPFKCTEPNCNKAFSRKEHLMRHIVSHTGKKMFSCDMCQKLFSRKDNLNKHKRTHSEQGGNNTQFVCEVCNKSFVVKMYYIQHKLMHEKNGQTAGSVKPKNEKTEQITEDVNTTNNQIQTVMTQQTQQQQQQQQQHQQQQQQQPQMMQLQISSPVVTTSGGNTISISQAPDHQQHTTTTVLKALGTHDTAVLNLPSSLANLVSINSAQFMTTGDLMGHIKIENK